MSMELMVRVMKASIGDPLSKLVLLKMADNASDDGYCWPSYQHIADQCEMDRRTAMRHVDKLCVCGFLKKELRKGVKGNSSNAYRLTPDNGNAEMLKNLKPVKKARPKGSVTETPPPSVTESPGVVSDDHQGSGTETLTPSGTESPESVTLLNQSLNQSLKPKTTREVDCPPVDNFSESDDLNADKTGLTVAEDFDLARWFWSTILELYERAAEYDGSLARPQEPNWGIWANELRLLRADHGCTNAQIKTMIQRIQGNQFWCPKIQTPRVLRDKWPELALKLCSGNLSNRHDPFRATSKPDTSIPTGFRG